MTVAMGMIVLLGRNYRASFDANVALKLRTEALAVQLQAETSVSDAARQEAEVANRAKTQFFTAASHDLRQPLHAMGLFAEALRQRTHDPEVAQLVNSINESVDALEGLFSELLDITRIDSGGVEVNPEHVLIGDIFRKLRLHFEPTAFEKGLTLRFRGGRLAVLADPLLVERILRNLVSNAIRYTTDGTVLASARRRGDRVLLQVWDTGVGIGDEERLRVFEEFYQVPGTPLATSVAQKKGLGLGLAIVKRLAALMGVPVTLRSEDRPGLRVLCRAADGQATARRHAAGRRQGAGRPDGSTASSSSSSRTSRRSAKASRCCCAAGGPASPPSTASGMHGPGPRRPRPPRSEPALVIADYRLEHGETGVDAIEALRTRFGADACRPSSSPAAA